MKHSEVRDEEITYPINAFFCTCTDKRGIIQSGNDIFAEVSGYDPDTLIGQPHKIVRHPDMSRALFTALWATLQNGKPFSAYVKNRASDGRYYWVFALVLPIQDGYISIRMAPRSTFFDTAKAIYADLRQSETARKDTATDIERVTDAIKRHGFRSYADFMASAIIAELHAREDAASAVTSVAPLVAMRRRLTDLAAAQEDLLAIFSTLYLVPTNMRILASRLEPSGGPVSAIADSYKRTATELMARLRGTAGRQVGAARELLGRMDEVLYSYALIKLLQLAEPALRHSNFFGTIDQSTDLRRMLRSSDDLDTDVENVLHQIRRLQREAEAIQRLMSGLEQVRILGEVESGRLRQNDGGLAAIMGQLHDFHSRIRTRLTAMITLSVEMSMATEQRG